MSVRPSSTISKMNISATIGPITMKFYQKIIGIGFWPDPIKTLVSMATDSSHRFISSPEPKAHGGLLVYQASRRPCVRLLTLSNMNISATSRQIATKFYLKHHWGGGKAALGFWPDRIGTLVSMATDSSHRVIMGKILLAL